MNGDKILSILESINSLDYSQLHRKVYCQIFIVIDQDGAIKICASSQARPFLRNYVANDSIIDRDIEDCDEV